MTIKVLDPTSEVTRETVASPARLQTLDGSSIGYLISVSLEAMFFWMHLRSCSLKQEQM